MNVNGAIELVFAKSCHPDLEETGALGSSRVVRRQAASLVVRVRVHYHGQLQVALENNACDGLIKAPVIRRIASAASIAWARRIRRTERPIGGASEG